MITKKTLKKIAQNAFEEHLNGKCDCVIKLNFRCPKGKFVPDSFECGKTPKEAKKNYKLYQKEKKEITVAKVTTKKVIAKTSSPKDAIKDTYKKVESDTKMAKDKVKFVVKPFDEKKFTEVAKKAFRSGGALDPKYTALSNYCGMYYMYENKIQSGVPLNDVENAFLKRSKITTEELTKQIGLIKEGFSNAVLPDNIITHRGIRESTFNRLKKMGGTEIGKVINNNIFMSTTLDLKQAEEWGRNDGNGDKTFLMELRLPEGTRAAYINDVAGIFNEKEVLVDSDVKFKVVGFEDSGESKTLIWEAIVDDKQENKKKEDTKTSTNNDIKQKTNIDKEDTISSIKKLFSDSEKVNLDGISGDDLIKLNEYFSDIKNRADKNGVPMFSFVTTDAGRSSGEAASVNLDDNSLYVSSFVFDTIKPQSLQVKEDLNNKMISSAKEAMLSYPKDKKLYLKKINEMEEDNKRMKNGMFDWENTNGYRPVQTTGFFPDIPTGKLILDHEFGHSLVASGKVNYSEINKLYVKNCYVLDKKGNMKVDADGNFKKKIVSVSKYGDKNAHEWWAENYTLHVNGRDDLVHPALKPLLKGLA
jgi:hypothetical protein